MPEAYREVRTARVAPTDGRVDLDIVVDAASVEVFAGDGAVALTMATFGSVGDRGLRIEGANGAVTVTDASLTPLRIAPVERSGRR